MKQFCAGFALGIALCAGAGWVFIQRQPVIPKDEVKPGRFLFQKFDEASSPFLERMDTATGEVDLVRWNLTTGQKSQDKIVDPVIVPATSQ